MKRKNCIVLMKPNRSRKNRNLKGVVRVTPEAEEIILDFADKSGLSVCQVVSQMVIQGSEFTCFEDDED